MVAIKPAFINISLNLYVVGPCWDVHQYLLHELPGLLTITRGVTQVVMDGGHLS